MSTCYVALFIHNHLHLNTSKHRSQLNYDGISAGGRLVAAALNATSEICLTSTDSGALLGKREQLLNQLVQVRVVC